MASLSRTMKKAASSVIPLAKTYTSSAIFTTPLKNSTINTSSSSTDLSRQGVSGTTSTQTFHHHHLSTLCDRLVRVIESETERAEKKFHDLKVVKTPTEFPFKIEDNAREKTIKLTREYQGEKIKVTVRPPVVTLGDDSEEDVDDEEEEEEEEESDSEWVKMNVSIPMDVCVTKKSGTTLEFNVMMNVYGVTINSLAVKNPNEDNMAYQGPRFEDLDLLVREAFRPFLVDRGIEPSNTRFLHDYMVNKQRKEYTAWLKKLKSSIADC